MKNQEMIKKLENANSDERLKVINNSSMAISFRISIIIVMIILAAAIIISINNSGIVNRANEAVEKSNEAELKKFSDSSMVRSIL